MALLNKKISEVYKDFLELDNSNAGLTAGAKTIKDGNGVSSCLGLGTTQLATIPSANSTTNVIKFYNGSSTLTVTVS